MALYAIGDLHLSLAVDKSMEIFGPAWENYVFRIEEGLSVLRPEDTLILAGDTSWGMTLEEAEADFRFLDRFPGKKYLLKGNYALCGTRGWFLEEEQKPHNAKVLNREVMRLETSLAAAGERSILCFLHYPPMYQGYQCPEILAMLEKYRVQSCCYGHLHGPAIRRRWEGERHGTGFSLISADYLGFAPKKICE